MLTAVAITSALFAVGFAVAFITTAKDGKGATKLKRKHKQHEEAKKFSQEKNCSLWDAQIVLFGEICFECED